VTRAAGGATGSTVIVMGDIVAAGLIQPAL
jgi:hypothetical protein